MFEAQWEKERGATDLLWDCKLDFCGIYLVKRYLCLGFADPSCPPSPESPKNLDDSITLSLVLMSSHFWLSLGFNCVYSKKCDGIVNQAFPIITMASLNDFWRVTAQRSAIGQWHSRTCVPSPLIPCLRTTYINPLNIRLYRRAIPIGRWSCSNFTPSVSVVSRRNTAK